MPDNITFITAIDGLAKLHIFAEADRLGLIDHDWYIAYMKKCLSTAEQEIGVDIPKGDH